MSHSLPKSQEEEAKQIWENLAKADADMGAVIKKKQEKYARKQLTNVVNDMNAVSANPVSQKQADEFVDEIIKLSLAAQSPKDFKAAEQKLSKNPLSKKLPEIDAQLKGREQVYKQNREEDPDRDLKNAQDAATEAEALLDMLDDWKSQNTPASLGMSQEAYDQMIETMEISIATCTSNPNMLPYNVAIFAQ